MNVVHIHPNVIGVLCLMAALFFSSCSKTGPAGPQEEQGSKGDQGTQGLPGVDGSTILSGNDAPSARIREAIILTKTMAGFMVQKRKQFLCYVKCLSTKIVQR